MASLTFSTYYNMSINLRTDKLGTTDLQIKFQNALQKVEDAVEHLRLLATIDIGDQRAVERQHRQARLAKSSSKPDGILQCQKMCVPWSVAHFEGRQHEIEAIARHLDPKRNRGQLQSVLLHGMGGVGKTETAVQFAHQNPLDFDAIFWIHSETPDSLKASFTEIATKLKLQGATYEGQDEQNRLHFQNWLEEKSRG